MDTNSQAALLVNGRSYQWPEQPVVVICVDGCQPDYLQEAISEGRMPWLAGLQQRGWYRTALGVLPSYTNPNNMSIVTGVPPAQNGICGNYFFDVAENAEVMMNDPSYLRAETIFQAFSAAGARVAVVTAKEKLRRMLGRGLDFNSSRCIAFSAECCDQTSLSENGIEHVPDWLGRPCPSVYSGAISEFVLAAGVKLFSEYRPDLMYLSTTDYVQHKYGPASALAIDFHSMLDCYFAELDRLGARLVITADHGMNAKHDAAGQSNVIYLQDFLDEWLGVGSTRVILPITDPYVVHHGSLGSFATIYLSESLDERAIIDRLQIRPEVQIALSREDACARFELPPDRVGDIVLISTAAWTIGTSRQRHDLAGLTEPLRSHGGLAEQSVPFVVNFPTRLPTSELRNFDAFSAALGRS